MKTLDCEKFLTCALDIDDAMLVSFLNETGYARKDSDGIDLDIFKKFISFMTASNSDEVAASISLDELAKMAHSIGEFGEMIAGNLTISYSQVFGSLNKMRSTGRRLL